MKKLLFIAIAPLFLDTASQAQESPKDAPPPPPPPPPPKVNLIEFKAPPLAESSKAPKSPKKTAGYTTPPAVKDRPGNNK